MMMPPEFLPRYNPYLPLAYPQPIYNPNPYNNPYNNNEWAVRNLRRGEDLNEIRANDPNMPHTLRPKLLNLQDDFIAQTDNA